MTLTLEIPDIVAAEWPAGHEAMARAVLEDFAVEAYRQGRLSAFQVRQLLGHESRWETEDFLATHDAWPGLTTEDLEQELSALQRLKPA